MIEISCKLLTGVKNIDDQHKEIIFRVNSLLHTCCTMGTDASEEAKRIIAFLSNYVVEHFADEEKLQIECNYPYYLMHKKEHDDFVRSFLNIQSDFIIKGYIDDSLLNTLNTAVVDWLLHHIGGSDVEFARFYLSSKSFLPRGPKII